jgi:hypothetical protein
MATINGTGGDDILVSTPANDTLYGYAGTDTARYSEEISERVEIWNFNNGANWLIGTSTEGADTLFDVEIVDGAEPGRILLVGGGGFDTLQEAVDEAQAGDTILINYGVTLTETVTVDKDVTIRSPGRATLIGGLHIVADGVTIENLRIRGGAAMAGEVAGVLVQADTVAVWNCEFVGNGTTAGASGLVTATGSGVDLIAVGNRFEGWTRSGPVGRRGQLVFQEHARRDPRRRVRRNRIRIDANQSHKFLLWPPDARQR